MKNDEEDSERSEETQMLDYFYSFSYCVLNKMLGHIALVSDMNPNHVPHLIILADEENQ